MMMMFITNRPPELVVERNKLRKLVRSTRINDRKAQITRKSQFLEEQQQSFQAEGHPVHHMSSTASAAPTRAPTITGEDDEGLVSDVCRRDFFLAKHTLGVWVGACVGAHACFCVHLVALECNVLM